MARSRSLFSGEVGVEQVQRARARRCACHTFTCELRAPGTPRDRESRRRCFTGAIGRSLEIGVVVLGALAALAVDRLHEVALAVEQAHRDERQLEVARRLAVVAREDAEAAGVDRQALVHAELGAEVRDQVVGLQPRAVLLNGGSAM